MAKRMNSTEKKNELKELHFEESFFLSNSVCTENHNLFNIYRQLKNDKRILCFPIFQPYYECAIDR